jgi:hypothetical protein
MSMLEWKTAVLKDTFWEPKKYAISNNRVYIAEITILAWLADTTICGIQTRQDRAISDPALTYVMQHKPMGKYSA